jgi:poly-gamma-glutamate synthesis protein (capsule biosynthesis protein)
MVFGTHPRFLPLFTGAGIDFLSLANNHITDGGTQGIVDTLKNLDRVGIAYAGAGTNLKEAGKRTILDVEGTKVAVIACVGVVPGTWAGTSSAGGLPCTLKVTVPLIEAARERADAVIVFAHFGVEYQRQPTNEQRKWAARWAAAGADLVIGAHPHVAGAIEQFDDTPVFYSLGNFIFDQNWSTPTMQALVTELTFAGGKVVQARVHPVIIGLSDLLQSQVNLLDPETDDGKELLRTVRKISFVDW